MRNHLAHLKPPQTVLERMGGYPEDLLEGGKDLSDRDTRKKHLALQTLVQLI